MSFATITAAQRLAVRDTALQTYAATQPFAQTQRVPTAAELALITPVLDKAAAALSVAGAGALPSTSVIVASGDIMKGVTVTGTGTSATFTVVAGKITAIALTAEA